MHANGQNVDNGTAGPGSMQFYSGGQMSRGKRNYELTNHLGNVLAVVTDKKIGVSSGGSLNDYYNADIVSATDYFPFGMAARVTVNLTNYTRFGFNGKEFDWEVKGWQNQVDYGMRVYDPRIGKFLSVDPLDREFPYWSPYHFSGNNPITFIDLDGAEIMLPGVKQLAFDAALTFENKPNSTKAKVYGAAMGIGGSVQSAAEGVINLFLHFDETVVGLWKGMTQTPYQNAADYAMAMAEKYGDLPESVSETAVKAHAFTDLASALAPITKSFISQKVKIPEPPPQMAEQLANTSTKVGNGVKDLFGLVPENKRFGSIYLRLFKYGYYWKNFSLEEAINKLTPGAEPVHNYPAGKIEYVNSQTGIKIVQDIPSDYFRIFDKEGNPLGINGKPIDAGKLKGKARNDFIQQNTHFLNSDNNNIPVTVEQNQQHN